MLGERPGIGDGLTESLQQGWVVSLEHLLSHSEKWLQQA